MSTHFTDAEVTRLRLPAGKSQQDHFETQSRGRSLVLTLNTSGRKTWSVMFYVNGKPKRRKLGYFESNDAHFPALTGKQAREAVRAFDVRDYLQRGKTGTFREVAESWLKGHVNGRLITEPEINRHLAKYVYPSWADRPFTEIRWLDVNLLLDRIKEQHGVRQADAVLTTIRSLMVWQQARDENYTSPIVKGMKPDKRSVEERTRDRVLDDGEIRGLWKALDEVDQTYAGIVKLALLTGERREKIVSMRWEDIDFDTGTWTIPRKEREKGAPGAMVLPAMALDVINERPRLNDNPYVFAVPKSKKEKHPRFNSWSQRKVELDRKLPIPHWTMRDLRRTTRSLLARIGELDHIAERVAGHKQSVIVQIYHRHKYIDEMSDALARLSVEIARVLKPERKVINFPA
jgi:integrase